MKQFVDTLYFIMYQPSICANEKFVSKISQKISKRKEGRKGFRQFVPSIQSGKLEQWAKLEPRMWIEVAFLKFKIYTSGFHNAEIFFFASLIVFKFYLFFSSSLDFFFFLYPFWKETKTLLLNHFSPRNQGIL